MKIRLTIVCAQKCETHHALTVEQAHWVAVAALKAGAQQVIWSEAETIRGSIRAKGEKRVLK